MCGCSSVDMHVPICVLCVIPRARESNEREISSRTGHPTMPISEPKSRGAACGVRCTGAMRNRNTSAHRPRLLSLHTPAVSKPQNQPRWPSGRWTSAHRSRSCQCFELESAMTPQPSVAVWVCPTPRPPPFSSPVFCLHKHWPFGSTHTQPGWPSGRWMSVQHMPKRKFVGADLP